MNEKNIKISKFIQEAAMLFAFATAVVSAFVAIINFLIANRFAPLAGDHKIIFEQVRANNDRDEREHPTFASKEDIKRIEVKLDCALFSYCDGVTFNAK